MSTAAAWDSLPVASPVRRPQLVLIPGGAAGATRRDAGLAARPMILRVPRWVRLAGTLCVLALALSLFLGIGGAGAAPGPLGSVEVRPGQTLSEIARAEMPGVPTAEAVARIQLANNLPSSQVRAGQVLQIPRY